MRGLRLMTRIGLTGTICILGVSMMAGAASAVAVADPAFHVTGVAFSGQNGQGPSPTVTITGSGFGTEPTGTSADTTSCGSYTNNGDVFGNKFYSYDDATGMSAGYSNKTSATCIGIIITTWTKNRIVFQWGNAYGTYTNWWINNGDNYVFSMKGYLWGGVVSGLTAAT